MLTYILNHLSLPEGGRILEIGPGCCGLALEFCFRGYEYYGYDMVEENLAVWQILRSQYLLDGKVLLQDICTIDTAKNESNFDGIISISTFEHIHNQPKALQNCYKLLKPDGRIIIIDGNIFDPRLLFNMIFRRKDGGLKWLFNKSKIYRNYGMGWKGKCEDVKSIYWWKKQLRIHGFTNVSITTTGAFHRRVKKLGIWPFVGSIVVAGQKN